MAKFMCILAAAISALVFVMFLMDAATGIPFKKTNMLLDIVFLVCAAGVVALSVLTLRKAK
ncbi:MAG: hypothetical protein HUK22_06565 [Thermoguttaceae bacterium]|nr:hypothetical protein [Thermoguttaceae bacterium]